MKTDLGKIAIVGSGAIGIYYGGRLAAGGQDVHFLLRSGYAEAITSGLRIVSDSESDVHLTEPQVYENSLEIGPCDWVIVATKATANRELPALIEPLIGRDTAILTLQNGLGNDAFLAGHFGSERILGGLCFICLTRSSPATVQHYGKGKLSLGEFERPPSPRLEAIQAAFVEAGVTAGVVPDLALERWRKLVWNIPFNGLSIFANTPVGGILADPELLAECRALMQETIAIAAAYDHLIPESFADYQIERTQPMGEYKPSSYIDFLAGNAIEVETIWGEPLRAAESAGVAVPHLQKLYDHLRTIESNRISS